MYKRQVLLQADRRLWRKSYLIFCLIYLAELSSAVSYTHLPYRPEAKRSSERKTNGAQEIVSADKAPKRSSLGRTVRVDVDLLDFLMNMVGELVIDRTRLTQLASRLLVDKSTSVIGNELGALASHLQRTSQELQEGIMRARLLPLKNIFTKFPRMTRDLASRCGTVSYTHLDVYKRQTYNAEAGMFLVRRLDQMVKVGELASDVFLRLEPSVFSPRVEEIKEGTEVVIYSESGRWLKVETKDGLCGFVRAKQVASVFERPPEVNEVSDYVPKSLEGDKVVLAWEQVYSCLLYTSP